MPVLLYFQIQGCLLREAIQNLFFCHMSIKKSIVFVLLTQMFHELCSVSTNVVQGNNKVFFVNLEEEAHRGSVIIDLIQHIPSAGKPVNLSLGHQISRFTIVAGNPNINNLFEIDAKTGVIVSNRRIDRDNLCDRENLCCPSMNLLGKINDFKDPGIMVSHLGIYPHQKKSRRTANECRLSFKVIYKQLINNPDLLQPSREVTDYCLVEINIVDLNDNAPRFILPESTTFDQNREGEQSLQVISVNPKLIAQVWISEASEPGTCIPLLSVTDDDSVEFGVAEYRLEPATPMEWKTLKAFTDSSTPHSSTNDRLPFAIVGGQCDSRTLLHPSSQAYAAMEYTSNPHQYLITPPDQTAMTTPHLMLLDRLDRETIADYWVRLLVLDRELPTNPSLGGEQRFPTSRLRQHTSSLLLRVRVQDTNDNTPEVVAQLALNVPEDIKLGSPVSTLTGLDRDIGDNGRLEYRIPLDQARLASFPFKIHPSTGVISISQPLDADRPMEQGGSRGQFKFQIATTDAGKPTARQAITDVTVHIIDVNDEAPEIKVIDLGSRSNPPRPSVLENQPPGQLIAFVTVTDADTGLHGMITCQLDNQKFELQLIRSPGSKSLEMSTESVGDMAHIPNVFEYQIVTTVALDRESSPAESIQIICADQALAESDIKTGQTRLIVRVLDENDNPPIFSQKAMQIKIYENGQVNEWVATFNATDADRVYDDIPLSSPNVWFENKGDGESIHKLSDSAQHSRVKYTLDKAGEQYFRVDSNSGMLYTRVSFDREKLSQVNFSVTASDLGSPTRNTTLPVVLSVLDRNDNAPMFLKSSYEWEVLESLAVNSLVGNVTALDADEGMNGVVHYQLEDLKGAAQWAFRLDDKTGQLWLRRELDREKVKVYQFKIRAFDDGSPRQTSECVITVRVNDVNDNAPKFVYPTQKNHTIFASVYTNPSNPLLKLTAVDPDEGENAQLTFHLDGDKALQNIFHLDAHSGELTLVPTDTPDRYKGNYQIHLKVVDGGDPPLSGYATIFIVLNQSLTTYHDYSVGSSNLVASPHANTYSRSSAVEGFPSPAGSRGVYQQDYLEASQSGIDKMTRSDKAVLDRQSAGYKARVRNLKQDKPSNSLTYLFSSERALVIIVCLVVVLAMVTFLFLIILTIVRRKSSLALAGNESGTVGGQDDHVDPEHGTTIPRVHGKYLKYPNCLIDCSGPGAAHPPNLISAPYSPAYPRNMDFRENTASSHNSSSSKVAVSPATPIQVAPGQWRPAVILEGDATSFVPHYQTIGGNYACNREGERLLTSESSLMKSSYTDPFYADTLGTTDCTSVGSHPLRNHQSDAFDGFMVDNKTERTWTAGTDQCRSTESFRCPTYRCQTLPVSVPEVVLDTKSPGCKKGPQDKCFVWSEDEKALRMALCDTLTGNKVTMPHHVKFQAGNGNPEGNNSGYQDLRFLNPTCPEERAGPPGADSFPFGAGTPSSKRLANHAHRQTEHNAPSEQLARIEETGQTSWKT